MYSREWLKPEEIVEAPGECVVGAYWVRNEDCEPNRMMVSCPFDKSHKMKQSKLAGHIVKCEKLNPNHGKVRCYFNTLEYIDGDKIQDHLQVCPFRANFHLATNTLISVDHALVESHLTTWENQEKEQLPVPEVDAPPSSEEDEHVEMKSCISFDLKKSIALENKIESFSHSDVTSNVDEDSEAEDLDEKESSSDTQLPSGVNQHNRDIRTDNTNICTDEQEASDSDENYDEWSNSSVKSDDGLLNGDLLNSSDEENDECSSQSDKFQPETNRPMIEQSAVKQLEEDNKSDRTGHWVSDFSEESTNNELYGSVDFSKNFGSVNNIGVYRMNHAQELFSRSSWPNPSLTKLRDSNNDDTNNCDSPTIDTDEVQCEEKSDASDNSANLKSHSSGPFSNTQSSQCSDTGSEVPTCNALRVIDHTLTAPASKPRRKLSLSDLAIFPDEPEPCSYYISPYDGLRTPSKVENEGEKPVFWQSTFKENAYEYNKCSAGYESSQCSDSDRLLSQQLLQSQGRATAHRDYSANQAGIGRGQSLLSSSRRDLPNPKCTPGDVSDYHGYSRGRGQPFQHPHSENTHRSPNPFQRNYGKQDNSDRYSTQGNDYDRNDTHTNYYERYEAYNCESPSNFSSVVDKNTAPKSRSMHSSPHLNMGRGQFFTHAIRSQSQYPGISKQGIATNPLNHVRSARSYDSATVGMGRGDFTPNKARTSTSPKKAMGRGQLMKILIQKRLSQDEQTLNHSQTKQFQHEPNSHVPRGVTGQTNSPQRILGRGAFIKSMLRESKRTK